MTVNKPPATDTASDSPAEQRRGLDRRAFLRRAGLVTGGVAVGGVAGTLAERAAADPQPRGSATRNANPLGGAAEASTSGSPIAFYGQHQPGVTDRAPAQLRFLAFDLTPAGRLGAAAGLAKTMTKLSAAAASMMAGSWLPEQGAVADNLAPAGLTITFGFGAGLVRAAGKAVPAALAPLPAFAGDALDPARSGGDLAIQVCAGDPLLVSSVARALVVLARGHLTLRWSQSGFLPTAAASRDADATPRNLMGQLDGTDNPTGSRLEIAVWLPQQAASPAWMAGGTYLVTRRIRMLLDSWQQQPTATKEQVIGRSLISGAPLSGGKEHTAPEFTARNDAGGLAIAADAHVRLAHPANNAGATMLRRGYSFDDGLRSDGQPDAGLFFQAFQVDPEQVFTPIQRRLAASDALRRFIRHESSAVFAIPPGASKGGWVGETLLDG